jgi:ornithine cyclodeaminase
LTLKAVSVFPDNAKHGLPLIHAVVLVFQAETGQPVAMLEGSTLTAIRTGAASGIATDLLANPDAVTATIFGAGIQGRTQLEAVCSVRSIQTAWIVDPDLGKAEKLIDELAGKGNIPHDLRPASNPNQVVRAANIICTATTSKTPIYDTDAIQPGTHINGVGSFTLEMIENPPELYHRVIPFVDSREASMDEAGEVVAAINQKILFPSELTEIGDVIMGKEPGRTSDDQITFFKSVGLGVQDATAAQVALLNATKMGLGQSVSW